PSARASSHAFKINSSARALCWVSGSLMSVGVACAQRLRHAQALGAQLRLHLHRLLVASVEARFFVAVAAVEAFHQHRVVIGLALNEAAHVIAPTLIALAVA